MSDLLGPTIPENAIHPKTRPEWRAWLEEHHKQPKRQETRNTGQAYCGNRLHGCQQQAS